MSAKKNTLTFAPSCHARPHGRGGGGSGLDRQGPGGGSHLADAPFRAADDAGQPAVLRALGQDDRRAVRRPASRSRSFRPCSSAARRRSWPTRARGRHRRHHLDPAGLHPEQVPDRRNLRPAVHGHLRRKDQHRHAQGDGRVRPEGIPGRQAAGVPRSRSGQVPHAPEGHPHRRGSQGHQDPRPEPELRRTDEGDERRAGVLPGAGNGGRPVQRRRDRRHLPALRGGARVQAARADQALLRGRAGGARPVRQLVRPADESAQVREPARRPAGG